MKSKTDMCKCGHIRDRHFTGQANWKHVEDEICLEIDCKCKKFKFPKQER